MLTNCNTGMLLDALAALERSYRLWEWRDIMFIVRRLKQLILLSAAAVDTGGK